MNAMGGWVTGTVLARQCWAAHLFSLQVEAEVEPFRPGQYNRLRLPVAGEWVARPYSYVNPPGDRPLEFYFRVVPSGPLSGRLAALEPGATVQLMPRASGLFTLDQMPPGRDLWLFATGTGLGPFLSILGAGELWSRFQSICLVHGVRSVEELAYQTRIRSWLTAVDGQLRYLPVLSRQDAPGCLFGRITVLLADGTLEAAAGLTLTPEHSQVMLCGNPGMVREVQQLLRIRGLERNRRGHPGQITVENYW